LIYLLANFIALFAIVGIGLFISSLCYTQQQAILGVFIFQTPAVLLSGFVSPVEDMPLFFRCLSMFNPVRYYMLIVKGIYFKNMDCLTVLTNLMPLILIAVFALYIARMSFKKSIKN
ncbi:ABC transporter permease, partial [bacterium]|nr:ABC transporter permease [bacterium]